MSESLSKRLAKRIIGSNKLIYSLVNNQYKSGHPFRAAALLIYTLPVRNLLRMNRVYRFTISSRYYNELQELMRIKRADGFELVRIGSRDESGYIMLDDFSGGIAYSFGVGNDVTWDKSMASRGYDVFMYDHTINGLPERNPRFHWRKEGIGDGSGNDESLKTLEEYITVNGHEEKRGMILKMDVEGAEWGFLRSVKSETLARFDQILFEFHGMINTGASSVIPDALRKLTETHQLIHIHPYNWGFISVNGKKFPQTLEVAYASREKYKFSEADDIVLPVKSLDAPNRKAFPEIELGRWNDSVNIDDDAYVEIEYL